MQTARTVLSVLLDVVGRTEQVRSRTVPAPEEVGTGRVGTGRVGTGRVGTRGAGTGRVGSR